MTRGEEMRELKNVEEKILDRALYLFGKNGSTNVSIRTIAKEAEVNVSAINYYFGSKENMLSNVQEFYIDNTILAYSELDNEELSDEEKVILCANEIMEYALRYPGVLVMQREAAELEEKDEMATKIINTTKEMHNKLNNILSRVIGSEGKIFEYDRMIFLSSILHPTNGSKIEEFNEEFMENKQVRIEYIKYILNRLKNNK